MRRSLRSSTCRCARWRRTARTFSRNCECPRERSWSATRSSGGWSVTRPLGALGCRWRQALRRRLGRGAAGSAGLMVSGSQALTVVPPWEESIDSAPPKTSTRSRMPVKPNPPVCSSASKPRPSSEMRSRDARRRLNGDLTCLACACLATFVSASWTTGRRWPGARRRVRRVARRAPVARADRISRGR